MRGLLLALGALVVVAGCSGGAASGATPQTAAAPKPAAVPRGTANLILEAEIQAAGVSNALEAVQRLRPSMLRARAGGSVASSNTGGGIVVYLDGVPTGGVETLANVAVLTIKEIRYLNAADATTRFGTGLPQGAILVATRR